MNIHNYANNEEKRWSFVKMDDFVQGTRYDIALNDMNPKNAFKNSTF